MQTAAILGLVGFMQLELPEPQWGRVEAFPTTDYWAYQVMSKRVLSGLGISAAVGMLTAVI